MYVQLFMVFCITVPDGVDNVGVSAFGVQCINVTWSGPNKYGLRGKERMYFVTYSKSDSDMSVTLNAGDSMFLPISDLTPGNNYTVEVCTCMFEVYMLGTDIQPGPF